MYVYKNKGVQQNRFDRKTKSKKDIIYMNLKWKQRPPDIIFMQLENNSHIIKGFLHPSKTQGGYKL